jgi:glycosyltransferase involved in cell wall biosynthesis
MVDRLNAWADDPRIDLEVWFNARHVANRDWRVDESQWRFRYRYLSARYWRGWWYGFPAPLLYGPRPDLMISFHSEPITILGLLICKLRGVPTAFMMEGPPDGYSPETPFKEWLKHRLFSTVEWVWNAGPQTQDYWLRYAKDLRKCLQIPHCIDVEHFSTAAQSGRVEREKRRRELGLEGLTFVYVGGLWPRKGVSDLLQAYAQFLAQTDAPASLLIVGSGQLQEALQEQACELGLPRVIFTGFVQKPELPRLLVLGDVFVFPTLADVYGYVVEEAMACGLPVVSTDVIGEAPTRVEAGVNGFLAPAADPRRLATAMAEFSGDAGMERARTMGEAAYASRARRGPQQWANDATALVSTMLRSRSS